MFDVLITIALSAVILLVFALILLNMSKKLRSPYNRIVRKIFLFGLFVGIVSLICQYFDYDSHITRLLSSLALIIITCGIVIVVWEEFKKGLEEVK